MPAALYPKVIDVPVVGLDQSPSDHNGVSGRLTTLSNGQVTHYSPAEPGVPQKTQVEQREAFVSMPTTLRNSVTGNVDSASDWSNPELLEALGDQLVSVCNGRPRAFNGSTWTSYPSRRVVPNKLSQSILHTTNHKLQAPDSARLGTTTCFVWCETSNQGPVTLNTLYVAFRGDDGAWIRTPVQLFQNNSGTALARVVQDGTYFWVFFSVGAKIAVNVYDTNGVGIASNSTSINQAWAAMPGYWDVVAPGGTAPSVMLIQPHANTTTGTDVGCDTWGLTIAGSVITAFPNGLLAAVTAAHCSGPVAWIQNTLGNSLVYCATVGTGNHGYVYEVNLAGITTKEYDFGAIFNGSGIPDALTGWAEANGAGVIAHLAYSMLSNFSPADGPPNDPALRYTRSYACTRAGAVSLTTQTNGVLLSTRAFQVDQDWYAVCYYQGGQGLTRSGTTTPPVFDDATDYLIGDTVQPLSVSAGDFVIGSSIRVTATAQNQATANKAIRIYIVPSQGIATITHNAGDSAVAATQKWTFLNAAFSNVASLGGLTAYNSFLRISGSSHSANNADFRVVSVVSATVIVTEAISTTGTSMVDDTLAGVTATLVSTTTIGVSTEQIGSLIPEAGVASLWGGTVSLNGTGNQANVGTFTIIRPLAHGQFPNWPGTAIDMTMFICAPLGTNSFEVAPIGETLFVTLTNANGWGLSAESKNYQDIGNNLVVSTAQVFDPTTGQLAPGPGPNDGTYLITARGTAVPAGTYVTGNETSLSPQVFVNFRPTISLVLADPNQAFRLHVAAGAFDISWVNAYVVISGLQHSQTDGTYQVVTVLSATDLVLRPIDGRTGQRNDNSLHGATISITRVSDRATSTQPMWFVVPLSIAQHAAGRFEWGQAFGDWRYDGETKLNVSTFERNGFPLALSSVTPSADGKQFALPYRAQSFTAGQVLTTTSKQTGLAITSQSTVGLKLFDLANAPGQAIAGSDELLLPGPQASQYSANGVTEDGINLGPERPYLVGQSTTGSALALTLNVTVQYAIAFELLTESGDRVWSTISPTLDVQLRGTVNQNTIGGRMPGPTDRVVTIAIYRTANVNGTPTIQHFKITNDLDVNGKGFTFFSRNGGTQNDSWQFVDSVPDAAILSAEPIYTDKGLLQRFPAPAYSQGISGWKARDWVVGYDGAVWMSGEKAEGDATWYHPGFRYTAFGDDRPVSVCAMDDYLLVFCRRTIWYIPAATFPDATGRNGILPTPVKLPFTNGGTGFAKEIRAGVAYSSSAGGVWLITRALENRWLSQPVRDSLTTVAGMAIDGNQRLWITTGSTTIFVYDQTVGAWWQWTPPNGATPSLVVNYQGVGTYHGASSVVRYTPGAYLDNVDGVQSGIFMTLTFSSLNFNGVRSFKRLWAVQITGTYLGPHTLSAVMSYPDDDHVATLFGPFTPTGRPYAFEINPMLEEASSYGISIGVSPTGSPPGQSCAIEYLSFEVGLERGINANQPSRRISGS